MFGKIFSSKDLKERKREEMAIDLIGADVSEDKKDNIKASGGYVSEARRRFVRLHLLRGRRYMRCRNYSGEMKLGRFISIVFQLLQVILVGH